MNLDAPSRPRAASRDMGLVGRSAVPTPRYTAQHGGTWSERNPRILTQFIVWLRLSWRYAKTQKFTDAQAHRAAFRSGRTSASAMLRPSRRPSASSRRMTILNACTTRRRCAKGFAVSLTIDRAYGDPPAPHDPVPTRRVEARTRRRQVGWCECHFAGFD